MKKFKKTKKIEREIRTEKKKIFTKELVWTLIIVVVMVASSVAYTLMQSDSGGYTEYEYNGVGFLATQNGWTSKINEKDVSFDYHPMDVENINISKAILDRINNTKMIYLTFDPDDAYLSMISKARLDLNSLFWENFQIYAENGVTKETADYELQVITCKNATYSVPVIYFRQGDSTIMEEKNNCIFFNAETENDILKLKDRMLYGLFGIINASG